MTWVYLWLFPANTAPCFLQVMRGRGTPLTMHSSTAGLLTCTDTAWEPSLIVGATEVTSQKYIFTCFSTDNKLISTANNTGNWTKKKQQFHQLHKAVYTPKAKKIFTSRDRGIITA